MWKIRQALKKCKQKKKKRKKERKKERKKKLDSYFFFFFFRLKKKRIKNKKIKKNILKENHKKRELKYALNSEFDINLKTLRLSAIHPPYCLHLHLPLPSSLPSLYPGLHTLHNTDHRVLKMPPSALSSVKDDAEGRLNASSVLERYHSVSYSLFMLFYSLFHCLVHC